MSRTGWPFVGAVAALVGAAAGHAVARLVNPAASPVVAVGAVAIDLTPTPLKEWAAATLGTADKVVLMGGVLLVVGLLGAAAGLLVERRRPIALGLVVTFAVVSAAAALSRPDATPLDVLPAIVAALVGGGVLAAFPRWVASVGPDEPNAADAADVADLTRASHPQDRRRLLLGGAGLVGAGGVLALLGERGFPGLGGPPPEPPTLPAPEEALPPLPPGLDDVSPLLATLRTPTSTFYRIDIALAIPRLDHRSWTLSIGGLVDRPYELTWDELVAMPMIERDITLTCVSNPIGGDLCGSTRWLGVPVAPLLRRAGLRPGADMVLSSAQDGFSASTPMEVLLDGRDAMIAVAMDGQPLTPTHGAPARLLTPGLYGYVGATKWLRTLEVTTFAASEAYWTRRGWSPRGPVKTACRIDTPRGQASTGDVAIAGVAWATHRGVSLVEVQVDDGPWQAARLGPDLGVDYWRQWVLTWPATPGRHRVSARATDAAGVTQPAAVRDVLPDGPEGYHVVDVIVG